jgi:excisionase family DNA binding protein
LDEVAEVLGVSRATVNRFIRQGELRVARLGWSTARVTHEALMDFLREREQTGPIPSGFARNPEGRSRQKGVKRSPGRPGRAS